MLVKTPGAPVHALGVLPHHHEVDVLGAFVLQGGLHPRIENHRPQIDVLVQLEAGPQQDALLQDARSHIRVADGPQVDGVELAQFRKHGVRQGFAGAQVAVAAQVIIGQVIFYPRRAGHRLEHLDALSHNLRTDAVTGDYGNAMRTHDYLTSRCFFK